MSVDQREVGRAWRGVLSIKPGSVTNLDACTYIEGDLWLSPARFPNKAMCDEAGMLVNERYANDPFGRVIKFIESRLCPEEP